MYKEVEKNIKDAKEYVRKSQIVSINNKDKEDSPEEIENAIAKYQNNQKLRLIEALLLTGDWKNAATLMKKLPEHYAMEYEPIATALCSLLHMIIEPIYRE